MSIDKELNDINLLSETSQTTTTFEWPNKAKYHNSINNPQYPKPLEHTKPPSLTFTIIGNLVTKEFLECVDIVTLMHKYKPYNFGKPIIEGLTQLEWAEVLKDLKYEFGPNAFPMGNIQVAVLLDNKLIGGYNDLHAIIEQKYHINRPNFCPFMKGVEELKRYVKESGRLFVYLNIAVNGKAIGTLIVELYTDLVPLTCTNFIRLCTEMYGGYSGSPVHRIVKDGWLQCGGYNLKSVKMSCENYVVHHDRRGVLSMANNGRHCDNSTQFFINLQRADWMDFKYVAFGQVIFGDKTLRAIEQLETKYEAPLDRVVISRTGMLDMEQNLGIVSKKVKSFTDGHIQNVSEIVGQVLEKLWKDIKPKLKIIKVVESVIIDEYYPILPVKLEVRNTESFIYTTRPVEVQVTRTIQQEDEEKSEEIIDDQDEIISEIVSLTKSSKTESSVAAQGFYQPKLYFHSLVNVLDRAENSLLEIELEPSQTLFTVINKVKDLSKYRLSMMPEVVLEDGQDYSRMDSIAEDEAYAYVEKYGDEVSFSGPTIAKIARNIFEPHNSDTIDDQQECYCKTSTAGLNRFVRESIIRVGDDEMAESTLVRFLRRQPVEQPHSRSKDSGLRIRISPPPQCFLQKDAKKVLTEETNRVSMSVLKKRITNVGQDQEIVLDLTKKRPSLSVAAYKLKHVMTTMFPEVESLSSSSSFTCDKCVSSDSNFSKDTESSSEIYDTSSSVSYTKVRSGLHLKGDTPTYVSLVRSVFCDCDQYTQLH